MRLEPLFTDAAVSKNRRKQFRHQLLPGSLCGAKQTAAVCKNWPLHCGKCGHGVRNNTNNPPLFRPKST